MKVITCTGFYGTGSSAVTDLFSDCESVECKSDYEIRILHDPYCVSDLEYNIVENPNRHNTSNAIKKFKWNIDFLSGTWWNKRYEAYFDGKFKKLSYDYIDSLCAFKYYSKWHWDIVERGYTFWVLNRCYNKVFSLIKKMLGRSNDVNHNLLPKDELAYAGICDEHHFLKQTRKYVDDLLRAINKHNKDIIFVDQLVPPSNFTRYSRYVNDLKIIVVDRDPRDLYLLEKVVWKGKVIPCYDPVVFCKWFKWTRNMYEKSVTPPNVMKIQFEDLVYKFDETRQLLFEFADIDMKSYKMKHFDPSISKKNTRLWEKYTSFSSDIEYIEKELADYCYML